MSWIRCIRRRRRELCVLAIAWCCIRSTKCRLLRRIPCRCCTPFMNLQAAASQHRRACSSSASCQLPAIRRCAARCWPTLSKLLAGLILAVRSLYALAGHADSRFYCTLDSGASGANERKSACFHGLLSVSARRGRQRARSSASSRGDTDTGLSGATVSAVTDTAPETADHVHTTQ